jgi:hypothetical protein
MTATMNSPVSPAQKKKFRVLDGHHWETNEHGQPVIYGPNCHAGDIVETDEDLDLRFNTKKPGFAQKFQRIDEAAVRQQLDLPANAHIFNPDIETFEQFAARIGQDSSPHSAPPLSPPEQVAQPLFAGQDPTFRATLASMTAKELVNVAAQYGIDLNGLTKRDDVLKKIRADLDAAPAG